MTYQQLAAAIEQITIWNEILDKLKSTFPHKGTADQKDNHQAQINSIELAMNQEINE